MNLDTPLVRRILTGMGANAFGQAITVVIQLVSLPLFLGRWDVAAYGTWLMISAMPAYLSMADAGMVTTAGNRMTMAMGEGRIALANTVFQSAMVFMAAVCAGVLLLVLPIVLLAPLGWVQSQDVRYALTALVLAVVLALFGGLAETVFRATGRYATGTMLGNLARLAEWGGGIAGLHLAGSFAAVAAGGLLARVASLLVMFALSRRGAHGLAWGVRSARISEIRAMVVPSLGFMAFPLAGALSFQGATILVGTLFGPVLLALFNTYRTLARLAVQVSGIFSHAVWPEFSRAFGLGGAKAVRPLYRRAAAANALMALVLGLALYLAAPALLRVWTHGAIEYRHGFMALVLLYAVVGSLWHVPRVLLMATNRHMSLALWSVVFGASTLLLIVAGSARLGFEGVGWALLLSEAGIAAVCVFLAQGLLAQKSPVRVAELCP